MSGVEGPLLQLRRLITGARKGGNDDDDDDDSEHGKLADAAELERRFSGMDGRLFFDQHLQEEARKLHECAKRRRHQRWKQEDDSGDTNASAGGCGGACHDGVRVEPGAVGRSSSLFSLGPFRDGDAARAEHSCRERSALSFTDPDAHLLVDMTDGSTRLADRSGGRRVDGGNAMFCSGHGTTPSSSSSSARAHADDDRERLLFIVDQLSHILRGERRQKEALLLHVVPRMAQRIEALEWNVALQRREISALRREAALRAELSCGVRPEGSNDNNFNGNDGDIDVVEKRVLALLEKCERQLHQLTAGECEGGLNAK